MQIHADSKGKVAVDDVADSYGIGVGHKTACGAGQV